jgi:acyl-CoA thioester hydrolase
VLQPFSARWRVRFDEIDLQGVVHHSQIVTYLEIARLEFWRHLGISYGDLRNDGYEFIVHELHVEYLKPLVFDEIIEANVSVKKLARASFTLEYEILKENGDLAVKAEIELVCARLNIPHPTALPAKYRQKLK